MLSIIPPVFPTFGIWLMSPIVSIFRHCLYYILVVLWVYCVMIRKLMAASEYHRSVHTNHSYQTGLWLLATCSDIDIYASRRFYFVLLLGKASSIHVKFCDLKFPIPPPRTGLL